MGRKKEGGKEGKGAEGIMEGSERGKGRRKGIMEGRRKTKE